MDINPSIFREYDIRGITEADHSPDLIAVYEKWYGEFPGVTLSREVAQKIGQIYGTKLIEAGGSRFVIGHEIRPFSVEIKESFIIGALSVGCDVIDAGESLTPLVYFANAFYGLDGAVSVTGSHNVYFFNGFKLMGQDNYPFYGDELQSWIKLFAKDLPQSNKQGKLTKKDIFPDYLSYITQKFKLARPLKVVLDCGNGTPGIFAPKLLLNLSCEVVELFTAPDALFPNHLPDPEDPYMLQALSAKVKEVHADLGIAFDADGDRFGSVDENGIFIPADHTLALFSRDYLSRHHDSRVLYDVKCSSHLDSLITKAGGTPLMHRTGHAPIKQTFRENPDIIFGGEIAGHFYFVEDYFSIDDGLFAAAKSLSLLSSTRQAYSALFSFFPSTVRTHEIKLPCEDSTKHLVVQAITDYFSQSYPTITLDGCRINFTNTSWGLVRASNTAPYLTVRLEADTADELLRIKNLLADQLDSHPSIHDRLDRKAVVSHTGKLGWL